MSQHPMYFDPKKAKKAKNRKFPDKTLPFDDSKQLSPVSDQVLDKSGAKKDKKRVQKCHRFLLEQKLSLTIFRQ